MQTVGEYGIPDIPHFVLEQGAPHMFLHSQDFSPASQNRSHAHQLQQHHHLLQQSIYQQQQHHQQSQPHQLPQLQQPLNPQHHHHLEARSSQQQHFVQQLEICSDSPDLPSPPGNAPHSCQFKTAIPTRDSLGDDGVVPEEGDRGDGCNRWLREETVALLKFRSEVDTSFRESGLRGSLWKEVSRKLGELGYCRSAKKCKEKFENVHKYYKKIKDGRAGRQDGKNYRFYSELEAFYAANDSSGGSDLGGDVSKAKVHGIGVPSAASYRISSAATEDARGSMKKAEDRNGLNMSSDSSEDDYYEPDENDAQENRTKRKRKSWSCAKIFFENLAKQVIVQQEELHQKFLETIERRDQERLSHEEACKRREMAHLNREYELRSQELALAAARDAALVAFMRKVTGETLPLPQIHIPPRLTALSEFQDNQEKESSEINTRRWPKVEVQALIQFRSRMVPKFRESGPKAQLWEDISASMATMGFNRSAKRCKEKWENIIKYFKKAKDNCRRHPDNAKTCPYFSQLELLYQKGILSFQNSNKFHKSGHSEDPLENSREDCEHSHGGNTATLSVVSAMEITSAAAVPISSTAEQLRSTHVNSTDGDQISKMPEPVQNFLDCNGSITCSSANIDSIYS